MITAEMLPTLAGSTVKSRTDGKIGKVLDAFASADGSHGTFVTVNTARVGTRATFVPIHDATLDGEDLVVPYAKALIKDAPHLADQDDLTPTDEQRLWDHYGTAGDVLQG